jgi:hypothetical protein
VFEAFLAQFDLVRRDWRQSLDGVEEELQKEVVSVVLYLVEVHRSEDRATNLFDLEGRVFRLVRPPFEQNSGADTSQSDENVGRREQSHFVEVDVRWKRER